MANRKGKYRKPLTDKEREILCLLALPDIDIAYRLYRSLTAIKQSKRAIFKKLKAKTRTEAIIKAIRQGEIDVWDFTLSTDVF